MPGFFDTLPEAVQPVVVAQSVGGGVAVAQDAEGNWYVVPAERVGLYGRDWLASQVLSGRSLSEFVEEVDELPDGLEWQRAHDGVPGSPPAHGLGDTPRPELA